MSSMVNAQAWKTTEKKQAINREATVKKRIINNQNALKITKDPVLRNVYETRIAQFEQAQADIAEWLKRIEAGDRDNTYRYNLLTSLQLSRGEALQTIVELRTRELAYEAFGGDFTEEAMQALEPLRQQVTQGVAAYEATLAAVRATIE